MDDIIKISVLVLIVMITYLVNVFTTPQTVEKIKDSVKVIVQITPLDNLFLKIGGIINGSDTVKINFGKNIMMGMMFVIIGFIYLNVNDYLKIFPPRFYVPLKFTSLCISLLMVIVSLK